MKKRVFSILMSVCVAASGMMYLADTAAAVELVSVQKSYAGTDKAVGVQEHTITEIRNYIASRGGVQYVDTTYAAVPDFAQPYSAGILSDATNQAALNMINQMRYIAGLSEVSLNSEYNSRAQAAAMVNAVNNVMSHYPAMPSGMSESLYNLGKTGASKSNLGLGYKTLGEAIINGWMNDGDAGNIKMLGHRRWVLYSSLREVGFGYAQGSGRPMTAMHVVQDRWSNYYDTEIEGSDQIAYKNIAWPAKYTPIEYFGNSFPWSLSTLDDEAISKINVKITRLGDNKTWEFNNGSSDFYVNNEYYGDKGCIIFRPDNITYNSGDKFTVEVTGLAQGSYSYDVEFFSIDDKSKFVDVDLKKWYAEGVQFVSDNGVMTGYDDGTSRFGTNDPLTRAQFATMLYRMAGTPETEFTGKFPDVPEGKYYSNAVEWCAAEGIVTGNINTGMFMTSANISRQDLAVMLYRYANYKGYDTTASKDLATFTDGDRASGYAKDALSWCAAVGILTGNLNPDGTATLDPRGQATRAQCATMVMRFMKSN